jgi:LysR family glycine cleavage system transcriptional activator
LANKIDLRKLPPLNALKGFEAATRRQSVREAADELCLTHPAISYQIQVLERDLGIELFSREGRSLVPTAEGRVLYKYVRSALEILIDGAETIRRTRANAPLRVQTYVTASIRWLARRLPDFVAKHHDIKILLTTYAYDWAFDDTIADVGLVYYENAPGPEYHWIPLFDYRLQAICSPELAQRLGPTPTPADVLKLPLVSVYSEANHWDLWCESANVAFNIDPAIVVDTAAVAIEIALEGKGVVLINGPFATDHLAAGRLVTPVSHSVVGPGSWGIICRAELRDNPRIKAFTDWLTASAKSK